ncbi:hypothetical protein OEJ84_17345 [Bacillus subtilis]|uniref:hypothetical protein n=1 Tax=Bacillus subtilis TaxID=1423 RepID=UPI0029390B84|nr:hypothetical protein [Bacillus subtilis]WNA14213.1 hypothetical protein phi182_45 [Bacillus phage phi18-2]WOF29661.1 hypothetical protein OEJ84_17345 [Bacillus subtilis]
MKPKFAIGDIVSVDGYKDRIFYVDCWREVTQHEEYGAFDYVEYDLTDAINGEWLEADSDDLRLVCRKAASEDFLMTYDMTNYPEPTSTAFHFADYFPKLPSVESVAELGKGLEKVASDMTKKKAKEEARQIDGLLDEYNDNMRLYEMFGDSEYKTKADGVMTKLRREVGE